MIETVIMPSPGQQAGTWCGLAGPQGSVLFPSTGTMLAPSPACVCDRVVRLPVVSGPSPRWALALIFQVGVSVRHSPESAWELWPWEGPKQAGAFSSPSPRGAEDKGLRCFLQQQSSQHALCSRPFHISLSAYNPRACYPGLAFRSSKGWLASAS